MPEPPPIYVTGIQNISSLLEQIAKDKMKLMPSQTIRLNIRPKLLNAMAKL
jgi:hypothetical protein